jgi:hypothetical protein
LVVAAEAALRLVQNERSYGSSIEAEGGHPILQYLAERLTKNKPVYYCTQFKGVWG